jgi:protein-disulfide isomerase
VLGEVLAEFPNEVRLIYRDFPLDFHTGARPAAEAARCAAAMGRFWEYHDLLFVAQPDFSREQLVGYAARLGLDRTAFAACLDGRRFTAAIDADVAEGRARGVRGTPTFFVNGRRLVGAQPIAAFREVIREALDEARK